MNERPNMVARIAQLAAEVGPALAPSGQHELLRSITQAAKDLFGAAACSLALLDEEEEHLEFHVASGAGADEVVGMRIPASRGIAGWVVTSGQPIAIDDVSRDPRFAEDVAESTGYVPRSILAMPLETERRMLGVISVLDRGTSGTTDGARDMELLGLFARQAALAIENSRVFSEMGRVLLESLAHAAGDDDEIVAALSTIAAEAPPPRAQLAQLAAHLGELGRMGPAERRAATELVGHFLSYLRARNRPR